MIKQPSTLAFGFCATLIAFGAAQQQRTYNVSHTEAEWARILAGQQEVQVKIRQSDIPASSAFFCDSVLNSQQNDIYSQVLGQKRLEADTTKKKAPKQ